MDDANAGEAGGCPPSDGDGAAGGAEDVPGAARDWWLALQIGLGLAGGAAWFAGALLERDFAAGVGCGLVLAALVLRLGRRSTGRLEGRRR